ncbi:MAG: hypothetical protein U9Q21_04490 [Candidatus Auribacterota bacterium]|nr:hypothetical protein [Candidatus Auribacterota bacterium]
MVKSTKIRTNYIIKGKLQLKYITVTLIIMLLASIITGVTIYQTGWPLMEERLEKVYPQYKLTPIMKAIRGRLISNLILMTPIIIILSIFLSHKIAGPIYRLETDIEELLKGNLRKRVRLRKGDELKTIADQINNLASAIDRTIGESKFSAKEISIGLSNLKGNTSSDDKLKTTVDKIQKNISELNEILSKFKTTS